MGDGRILLKPRRDEIPLKKSYRMSLISARSISLDSTFNERCLLCRKVKVYWKLYTVRYISQFVCSKETALIRTNGGRLYTKIRFLYNKVTVSMLPSTQKIIAYLQYVYRYLCLLLALSTLQQVKQLQQLRQYGKKIFANLMLQTILKQIFCSVADPGCLSRIPG